jgi:3-oxoacyl-[acyl-carrier-protein] synthase II
MKGAVAIVGAGAVTASGVGVDALFDDLFARRLRYSLRRVGLADTGHSGSVGNGSDGTPVFAAHAERPPIEDFVPARAARAMGRDGTLFCHAGFQAVTRAGLLGRVPPERIGVVCGTISAGCAEYLAIHEATRTPGSYVNPTWGPQLSFNAPASLLSIHASATGPNLTLSAGDAVGLAAVLRGADLLMAGHCDAVIAGGVDTVSSASGPDLPSPVRAPYTAAGGPPVPGEAGAALVMMRAGDAGGMPVLGHLAAAAEATVVDTADDTRAAAQAVTERVLADSGLRVDDLGLVVTSSSAADGALERAECQALYRVLCHRQALGHAVPVCNVSATTGRAGGADGALAVLVAVEALRRAVIPPIAGVGSPAADLPALSFARTAGQSPTGTVALVLGVERPGQARAALVVSDRIGWRQR